MVGQYVELQTGLKTYKLFRHKIDESKSQSNIVEPQSGTDLGSTCADFIKARDQLITIACLDARKISFIDRESLAVID